MQANRHFHHNRQVLILDDLTRALDNHIAKVVMEAVNNLVHDITIIFIPYRLITVKSCDQVYLL